MIAINLAVKLFIMTCIGIYAAKCKVVNSSFAPQLTQFLMKISIPCLIFSSIVSVPFSLEAMKSCAIALALGIGVCILSFFLGQIIYLICKKSFTGRLMRYGITFPHFSFMGIPIMDALYGSTGNLYYSMFLIPVRIMYYTLTPKLLSPDDTIQEKKALPQKLKQIFNPCFCAVLLGLVFWIFHIQLPDVILYCVDSLSKICSPLGLILCGLIIGKYQFRRLLNTRYFILPLIKTIALPAIFFIVSQLLKYCHLNPILCEMIVIHSALPVASLTAAFTIQYDPDLEHQFEAAGNVFIATMISIVTVPFWYYLLQIL